MKKVIIVLTGVYPKFTPATAEKPASTKMLYNYAVISGDVKQYSADKESTGHLSLQDDGAHKGAPRFVSSKNLGEQVELNRITRKDGTSDWFTDNTEQMLIDSEINSLPDYAKAEVGKQLTSEAIARAKATASKVKALRATAVVADLKKS